MSGIDYWLQHKAPFRLHEKSEGTLPKNMLIVFRTSNGQVIVVEDSAEKEKDDMIIDRIYEEAFF